jgi:hypothetical protein
VVGGQPSRGHSGVSAVWNNPEAWIAVGVSVLFLVAAVVMHRVIVRVLKNESPPSDTKALHE